MSKIWKALLSGAIAIAIWGYVVTVVNPNYDVHFNDIPVTVQGEAVLHDRGLMITYADTMVEDLHLEGTRVDLNKLSSSNIGIVVDASKIYETGTHSMTYNVTYPGDVSERDINIRSRIPGAVTLKVEERISKFVPVEIRYSGSVEESFVADKENKVLDHTQISVTGPKSVIDRIDKACIDVDLEGRNESINEEYPITLCDAEDAPVNVEMVTTDYSSVVLTLKIMRVKEIQLLLEIIPGGGATEATSEITLDTTSIWISGSDNLLENMENLTIGSVDLAEIPEDKEMVFPIVLPEGITCETGVSEVKVDIKFPELATKTLTVKEITAVNVPAGLKAELLTKALDIQIRGPKDKLDTITEEMLKVEADFTETELGAVKVKVIVTCADENFGAVGTYTVSATVKEEQ